MEKNELGKFGIPTITPAYTLEETFTIKMKQITDMCAYVGCELFLDYNRHTNQVALYQMEYKYDEWQPTHEIKVWTFSDHNEMVSKVHEYLCSVLSVYGAFKFYEKLK